MSFKFSTNFLLPYVRKPAKYGGRGSIGLDATPTVLIHIGHPVESKEIYSRDKIPKFIQSRSKRVISHENNYFALFPTHFITNSSLHKRKRLFIGSTQAHTPDRDHITLYV